MMLARSLKNAQGCRLSSTEQRLRGARGCPTLSRGLSALCVISAATGLERVRNIETIFDRRGNWKDVRNLFLV